MIVIGMSLSFVLFVTVLHIIGKVGAHQNPNPWRPQCPMVLIAITFTAIG